EVVAADVHNGAGDRAGTVAEVEYGGVIGDGFGAGGIGEGRDAGDGRRRSAFVDRLRRAASGQVGNLHFVDGDGGPVNGQRGRGFVSHAHVHGVRAFFGVGVPRGIDLEIVAADIHDRAGDVAGTIAEIDDGGVVADGLGAGGVGEGRDRRDGGGRSALVDRLRRVRAHEVSDLHFVDGDGRAGD